MVFISGEIPFTGLQVNRHWYQRRFTRVFEMAKCFQLTYWTTQTRWSNSTAFLSDSDEFSGSSTWVGKGGTQFTQNRRYHRLQQWLWRLPLRGLPSNRYEAQLTFKLRIEDDFRSTTTWKTRQKRKPVTVEQQARCHDALQ